MKTMTEQYLQGMVLMTVFSYLATAATGKEFREPWLLALMLHRLGVRPAHAAGWAAHAVAGLGWAPVLRWMAARTGTRHFIVRSMVLGLASGAAAVGVWHAFFTLHPAPPANDRKSFYIQLVIAHWLFSLPFATGRSPRPSPLRIQPAGTP